MNNEYEVVKLKGEWYLFDDADDIYKMPVREVNKYVKRYCKKQNTRRNVLFSLKHLYGFLEEIGIRHPSRMRQEHQVKFRDYMMTVKEHRGDWDRIAGQEGDNDTWNSINSNVKNYMRKVFPSTKMDWEEDPKTRFPDSEAPTQVTKNINSLKGKDIDWGTKAISVVDFVRILSHCTNSRDKLIFEFIYQTGIRIGELFNIDRRQFEPENIDRDKEFSAIFIHDSSSPDERKQTKTGNGYILVLNRLMTKVSRYVEYEREENSNKHYEIFTIIKDQVRNGKIITKAGDPLTYGAAYQSFKTAAKRAGIKATIHDLRHSYAMNRLVEGVNVKEVQAQLRHKNLSTTSLYTKGLGQISPKRLEIEMLTQDVIEKGVLDE